MGRNYQSKVTLLWFKMSQPSAQEIMDFFSNTIYNDE